jgi:hypothetical protein
VLAPPDRIVLGPSCGDKGHGPGEVVDVADGVRVRGGVRVAVLLRACGFHDRC